MAPAPALSSALPRAAWAKAGTATTAHSIPTTPATPADFLKLISVLPAFTPPGRPSTGGPQQSMRCRSVSGRGPALQDPPAAGPALPLASLDDDLAPRDHGGRPAAHEAPLVRAVVDAHVQRGR